MHILLTLLFFCFCFLFLFPAVNLIENTRRYYEMYSVFLANMQPWLLKALKEFPVAICFFIPSPSFNFLICVLLLVWSFSCCIGKEKTISSAKNSYFSLFPINAASIFIPVYIFLFYKVLSSILLYHIR
jgi:hypothetical protein